MIKEVLKPTKLKIYSFIILITGLFIPKIIKYLLFIYSARTLSIEKFDEFSKYLETNIPLNLALFIIYIIWLYIIIALIINITKSKKEK